MSLLCRGLTVCLGLMVLVCGPALAGEVSSIQVRHGDGTTVVDLQVSSSTDPSLFTLENPQRLVLDLPGTTLGTAEPSSSAFDGTVIDGVRSGTRHGRDLRMVFDLNAAPGRPEIDTESTGRGEHIRVSLTSSDPIRTLADQQSASTPAHPATPAAGGVRDIVVAIDPGHGGHDPGAHGDHGVQEKTVVLGIARQVVATLNRTPGFDAFLTRTGDYFIPLEKRVDIARRHKADFFVSIHANTVSSSRPRGTMVFALSPHGASSTMASWMAARENHSSMVGGNGTPLSLKGRSKEIRQTLVDLSLESKISDSLSAGRDLLKQIGKVNRIFKSSVEQANFAVLRSPDIPSLLVETDFLSNAAGERLLASSSFQHNMGRAIADGIEDHFTHLPPMGSLLAWQKEHPGEPVPGGGRNRYTVRPGDSLSVIAARHDVSTRTLKQANHLAGGRAIQPGDTLIIPSA
ncbi:N-acetylmuramoyl-L-alanine amidase [Larsenimonas rhizosphaerae]|uniref:N-acetylmuramoyl-L-alanine amidase n=1 Tax=Larsenimonas rhizosphaerae TaxID=2944682 RepID=A0AA41ZGR2_9GAMM|nr:N-acetylmuramoyl-L-alanine amidase [Larsenimonas rhizosphaerae]MCX2524245.1 N-acetylmuramoyl-L-alanine amidase [Larsenimonas rhizosphaerae]